MLNSNLVHSGLNLLAVGVHQASLASDDLSFDLELTGYLAAPQPPTITQQPDPNQTVSAGSFVSFIVQAAGTSPLAYQWYHNNAPIAGANLPAYTIVNAQAGDAGIYTVRVLNAFGSVFSNGFNLSVSP